MRIAVLIIALTIAVVAQTPKAADIPTLVVHRLNPEASKVWQNIEDAKEKLRQQYAVLESQQAALMIGGNVPPEARSHCLNDKGVVVCAIPAPAPTKPEK